MVTSWSVRYYREMNDKVLLVCTNTARYPDGKLTGIWLSELVHLYHVLEERSIACSLVSPKGGAVPIDPRSLSWYGLDRLTKQYQHNTEFTEALQHTQPLPAVDPAEYRAVYYVGGHGAMYDLYQNDDVFRINRALLAREGTFVSAVCHGVAALIDKEVAAGRKVTGYSWLEERLALKDHIVPFSNEAEFERVGAQYEKAILPFISHVVTDGPVLTGQNPQSSKQLAKVIADRLRRM